MTNFEKTISALGLLTCALSYQVHSENCSFTLPPNEQVIIKGNTQASKTLDCKVEDNGLGNDYLLNFISENNTSIVNNLVMPEGTIMSLSFPSEGGKDLCFKLKPNAKLGITNDTSDFIRVKCF